MSLGFPFIAAAIYATASYLSKEAMNRGAGLLRLAFVTNWMFLLIFGPLALLDWQKALWSAIGWPILTGVFFFLGHVFTFAAIRAGDVSLQTPLMGTKTIFVALLAIFLGVQELDGPIILAAAGMTLAIVTLAWPDKLQSNKPATTVALALLSSLFFAFSDISVAQNARDFGAPRTYLSITMLVNALLSFSLVPFFKEKLAAMPKVSLRPLLISGAMMAGQALLMNLFLALDGRAAEANIAYSTRGLWSVIIPLIGLGWLAGSQAKMSKRILLRRIIGAAIMTFSITMLFR